MTPVSAKSAFSREELLRWREGNRVHEARIVIRRWISGSQDRLYLHELLACGGALELGNLDLTIGRWFTARGAKLPSHARGAAITSFVMVCIKDCSQDARRP